MKSLFTGYYAPTETDYKRLWKEGLVVLDTNVLLDLYRLPATARDDVLSLFKLLRPRLWVPYQVALEFQRRRLTVISAGRKVTEDALTEANDLFGEVQQIVGSLEIDKRGLGIEPDPLLSDLKAASDKLVSAIKAVHSSQLDIAVSDPIRDQLDELLVGRIGPPPKNQAELDSLIEGGEERYGNKVPPGYLDADKDKNPNEATFYHDGLRYQRKYGDLILWRQLIAHVREKDVKALLLVTSDRKDDWWWREKGKTIGPRPELAREILQAGGAELFWMYSSDQFLESAKHFTDAKVAETSVTEIKEVVRIHRDLRPANVLESVRVNEVRYDSRDHEVAVYKWLSKSIENLRITDGFPDFVSKTPEGVHGFEVKRARNFFRFGWSPVVSTAILRGYAEVHEGRLTRFSLIVVADAPEWSEASAAEKRQLVARLDRLLAQSPIFEVIIGYVAPTDEFEVIIHRRGRQPLNSDWIDEPSRE